MASPTTTCRICSVEGVVASNACNQSPDDSNEHLLKVISTCSPALVKGDDVNVLSRICVVCKHEMLRLHRFMKVLERPIDAQPESSERDERGYLGDYNSNDENSSDGDGSSQSSECADEFVREMKKELKVLKTEIVDIARRRIGFDVLLGDDKRFANLTNNVTAPMKKSMQNRIIAKLVEQDLNKEPLKCKICKKTFEQKSKLIRHRASHKKRACTKKVPKISNPQEHNTPPLHCGMCSTHLLPSGNVRFMCDVCGEDFPRPSLLLRHTEIHVGDRTFKCPVCDAEFARMSTLRSHLSTHLEKRFKCDVCRTAFAVKSDLDVHMIVHMRRNRYVCKVCPQDFTCKLRLNEHMLSHVDRPPFKCIVCQQRFTKLAEFRRHSAVHDEERAKPQSIECDISSVKLEDESQFNELGTAHVEMPFKCDTCSQGFELEADLETHATVHAGDRPFKCKICQKGFTLKKELTAHMNLFEFENSLKALEEDMYIYPTF